MVFAEYFLLVNLQYVVIQLKIYVTFNVNMQMTLLLNIKLNIHSTAHCLVPDHFSIIFPLLLILICFLTADEKYTLQQCSTFNVYFPFACSNIVNICAFLDK